MITGLAKMKLKTVGLCSCRRSKRADSQIHQTPNRQDADKKTGIQSYPGLGQKKIPGVSVQTKGMDQNAKEKALQSISSMSSAQIVSATAIHSKLLPGIVRASFPGNAQHLFVHISQSSPSYSDPLLECVDIRQIYDKFPEKKGGLKELFSKGPQNAFYLIKFWVRKCANWLV
ncbi:hypothetical protein GOODEAATRI_001195 [Goodea atripinnis]|uniref:YAP binding domain-containing protein n=1 Tax=Goodea atripinnis TaxID=208336 RepID=A0ABV0MND3_9TELE